MDRATDTQLVERVFLTLDDPELGVGGGPNHWPVSYYLDERRFQRELEMARRKPIPLAHVSQLAEPGDFVAENLLGRPVVAVRGGDGELRAFLNVCRHRGSELIGEPCGHGLKRFVCPYHAWTYDTDGRLVHVPDQRRSFENLDREQRGLVELACTERHGFAWVVPDPAVRDLDLEAFIGPELESDLGGFGIENHKIYRQHSETWRFNWKTGVESFLETYHFAILHRTTAGPVFVHNLGLCDQLGVHFRAVAPKKTAQEMREVDRSKWTVRGNATVMYVVYPFSCLFVEKDHFHLLRILPEAVDRCRVEYTHLVRRLSPRLEKYWDANIDLFLSAVREDFGMCESMQRGYASGANETTMFGRNEAGCHMFRECIEDELAASNGHGP